MTDNNDVNIPQDIMLLNLYLPTGKETNETFIDELSQFLPGGTIIKLIENAEVPTLNEVGFSLNMHDKLYLTQQFVRSLGD